MAAGDQAGRHQGTVRFAACTIAAQSAAALRSAAHTAKLQQRRNRHMPHWRLRRVPVRRPVRCRRGVLPSCLRPAAARLAERIFAIRIAPPHRRYRHGGCQWHAVQQRLHMGHNRMPSAMIRNDGGDSAFVERVHQARAACGASAAARTLAIPVQAGLRLMSLRPFCGGRHRRARTCPRNRRHGASVRPRGAVCRYSSPV
jgi:hypothetical protein